ncbi:bifunctional diaminohydroxyphosphoribosylaminopyrimidine deaminase/5-amino-6-(5-phosphoribosylamino)uracil reductase RibD [Gellertiella hungarica]|uniref:Riboflavin biosynthesis protein RibD n=1 Tax=Gellertiella hungarica TaxID=1572859 RepID=A0A7W6NL38_9HYPH|nr:bifunctional diaminohydroxyphosphoribosylaminopyrimidine deaminase/5-amino-6-(5-phosphoribosylamino)uracil reductase RibD [Gellertiella hungarica]MBB4065498.1 diaminohydroxyphosphoribosylaminopyrimidine deaminase/5-amino-6-(5-phosphoribosylamino)uracil reductase [Gellertiella hungarica]
MPRTDDRRYMAAALRLARWHTGLTSTNPSVGCIVVKDGAIVGTGVTAVGGRPHAETQALADAGPRARGATVYVTLEPCSHHGKTPPCADALIASGVARVVVSVTDPDIRVSGRGLAMLAAAGISVEAGVLEEEGREVLSGYLMRQVEKRPHVTLKLAVSADGMIGRTGAGQVSVTGPLARAQVHALRAEMDAILVGAGTALADDPLLDVRLPGLESRSPHRFVLGRDFVLPTGSKLALSADRVPLTLIGGRVAADGRNAATSSGRSISPEPAEEGALLPLLNRMAEQGISSLLVEGGAKAASRFLDAGLVDRILLFEGPGKIGADGIASPLTRTHMPAGFRLVRSEIFGPDRAYHYERDS